MALLTTSRYASQATRKAARALAASSGARFLARGKKTVASLASFARRNGHALVGIVEERGGKPAFISTMEVLAGGGWRWSGKKEVAEHEGKGKNRG
jgi:rRNA maturation protein Rpf1